ncbi:MAG: MFS transporter [Thermomicrobiales bacterium]
MKVTPKPGVDIRPRNRPGPLRILTSLQDSPRFRLLWFSNMFFFGGAWTQTLVLGWLVYETTQSAFLLAVFTSARLAPLLLGPVGGVLSDRFDRVRMLIVACLWALAAISTVSVMVSVGYMPFWALVLGGFAIGLAQSPSQPARAALVLDLVGRENLSNANALNAMAINVTQVIGPALGGAMISAFGAPAALWISTAWYGVSFLAIWPLRSLEGTRHAHPEPVLKMLTGGFRGIVSNRLTAAVLLITLAANILIWPIYQGFIPAFAASVLDLDAAGLGWLLTCAGIGGLTGSLIIASLGDFRFQGGFFVVGTTIWGVLWALFGLSHSVPLSFLLMGGIGLLGATYGVLQTTLMLMTTEPGLQGRALGMLEFTIGIMPVSSLVLGVLAERMGMGPATLMSGLLLAMVMVVLATRMPELLRYSGIQDG